MRNCAPGVKKDQYRLEKWRHLWERFHKSDKVLSKNIPDDSVKMQSVLPMQVSNMSTSKQSQFS